MARVGLHGQVQSAKSYLEAIPVLDWLFDQVENTINGQIDSTNLQDSAVTTNKLALGAVTNSKLAVAAVSALNVDTTVAKIVSQQYTGDGTSNREINIGFRARLVIVVRHDTRAILIAWGGISTPFARVQIDNAGNITDGGTDFTGTSTNGFTLGSAAGGGVSNANTQTYSFVALG